MSEPQSGIVPEPSQSAVFLVLRVREPGVDARQVARAAAATPSLTRKVGRLDSRAKLLSVIGFGPEMWKRISPDRGPAGLRPFRAVDVGGLSAPHTGGDLLLHVVSKRQDLCLELAFALRDDLGDRVEVMEEVHGFRYLDSRDLTGFIDGTENPKGARKRSAVSLIGGGDRVFAGGSYVFTQRYVHDLEAWRKLPVVEQERAVGRRKRDSRELGKRTRPPTAHVSRVVIVEDGDELEIVRHSFPYGSTSEKGLFFIAYTNDLGIPEKMLARMFGTSGDGLHDHLMDFTRPVSGAHFFAPSLKVLRSLGRAT